ncbi:MAG TPA: hypothetical protein VE862_10270 [Candidatus Acidoferrum sp.]|nr:hypothetical protein [Candidatus Acidoferrum sp.]
MTQWGTWVPYAGTDAIFLGITVLVVGVIFAYLGIRLKHPVAVKRPGKTVSVFIVLIWCLSLVTFFVALFTYAVQLSQMHMIEASPTNPISNVTIFSAIAAFAIITCATRKNGLKSALGSALVGTMAGPMIFELPFDLIVMSRTFPAIPPYPTLFRLLFFLPLFLVEVSTFSLLTLSPVMKLSKYTLFALAGVFFVFAVWALFGFSYPSDGVPLALNTTSKILSFVTAITLFVRLDKEGSAT